MEKGSKIKLLVVDDDETFLSLIKRILGNKGYLVEVTDNGEEAISKIHDFQPQLIILDIMMPRLTGDELVKMIRAWKPEIEIIMVSGVDNQETKDECRANGAYDCLDKPVNFDLLDKKIKEAISKG